MNPARRPETAGLWYRFDNHGEALVGWQVIAGNEYYFWSDGEMATGWHYIYDSWYYFDKETGIRSSGWVKFNNDWVYLRPEDGTRQTYWRYIDGEWYYFGRDAKMHTGWNRIDGSDCYFYKENDPYGGPAGAQAHDVWIDDVWLQSDGTAWTAFSAYDLMIENAQYRSSPTQYLIMIDTTNCVFGVFEGSKNNWNMLYYWYCAPGTASTPTVLGEYSIEDKGYYFYSGSAKCLYWCAFYQGLYCIHSTLYYSDGVTPMDSRTGIPLSHGCVRLQVDNAYWVWENCPIGTTVVTY